MTSGALIAHDRCAACDAPLAADQCFCLACGLRCAPDELRLAALPLAAAPRPLGVVAPQRRPVVRSAAITAVVVLSMGVAIGATIGPATIGQTAAAETPLLLVAAPAPAAAPADEEPAPAGAADAGADPVPAPVDAAPAAPLAEEGPPAGEGAPDEAEPPAGDEPPAEEPPAGQPLAEGQRPGERAAPPNAVRLAGVVLAADVATGRFTLADRAGRLREVHAGGCGVRPGDDLHLRAWPLANGTWAADRVRRLPQPAARLMAAGVVSWVDPAGGRYALGARGVTLLVVVPPPPPPPASPAGATATAPSPVQPPALPALGERVRVALEAPGAPPAGEPPAPLLERRRTLLPPAGDPALPPAPLDLRGRVASLDAQAGTLALALDPLDPTATVTLALPAALDPVAVGDELLATVDLTAAGAVLDAIEVDDAGTPPACVPLERPSAAT